MTDNEVEEAIHDLTVIVSGQAEVIRELQARVKWLERNTKRRRLSMVEAMGYAFSDTLGAAMGK